MSEARSRWSVAWSGPSWLAALLLTFLVAPSLVAQQEPGVIAGRVVAERTQQPLPAAQIAVEGTNLGAQPGSNGEVRITGVSGTSVRITVRRIGYGPVEPTVRVGSTDLVIAMSPRAINLDEVI